MKSISAMKQEIIDIIMTGKYEYVGIRLESKAREIGEICEPSKDNPDREDPRDYPEYGSDEYNNLPTLDGTSAWMVYNEDGALFAPDYDTREEVERELIFDSLSDLAYVDHAYLIGGHVDNTDYDLCDPGEIVIDDAEVLLILK